MAFAITLALSLLITVLFTLKDVDSYNFRQRRHTLSFTSLRMSSDGNHHYDYLVIGGGSGGVASARRAAAYNAKVAIIEKQGFGGTCVNVGCVPKKVMFNAAAISEVLHDSAEQFGFTVDSYKFDWNKLKVARDAYISRLNGIYSKMLKNNKVEIYEGIGTFTGPKEVTVGNQKITAEHILIAVGGKPYMPPDVEG